MSGKLENSPEDLSAAELRRGYVQRNALAKREAICSWDKLIWALMPLMSKGIGCVTTDSSRKASSMIRGRRVPKNASLSASSKSYKNIKVTLCQKINKSTNNNKINKIKLYSINIER